MSAQTEPTRDELLAMAYADGELDVASARAFEERLPSSPELAQQVAEYQALQVMGRRMAPPEPMDFEWERLEVDPTHRAGLGLGWALLALGAIGGGGWSVIEVAVSDIPPLPKTLALALIGGFFVLFVMTLRGRIQTLPYDSYRKVER